MALALVLSVPTALIAEDEYPSVDFGGRLQLDYTFFDNDKFEFDDGGEMRRGRLFVKGKLAKDWDYKVQYDFAPDDPELKAGYIRYSGLDKARVWVGNFKQPSSLEQLTSSKYITFTERGLVTGTTEGRRMGVGYQRWGKGHTWMATIYGDEANGKVKGNGVAGRFVYQPETKGGQQLHLGLSGSWNEDDDDTIRLRVRPESHQDSHRILNTGNIENVDDFVRIGLESAYVSGRFSAQAEFTQLDVNRSIGEDLSFSGYYAYASFFLTDDSRPYASKDGAFGRVKPKADKGAWEVALRYSSLDLTDEDVFGGKGEAVTLGLNYYATPHLRFMADYIATDTDEVAGDDDPSAIQLRLQYDF
jgi:phosphate-selective porin OprO/OprP